MKTLLVVFMAIFAAAQAAAMLDLLKAEWDAFKNQHNKHYNDVTEDQFRMKIFMENKQKIAEHNRKYEAGHVSYKLAMNKYGDMHHDEFVRTMNGFKKPSGELLGSEKRPARATFIAPANVKLPSEVDWRKNGSVTPVKDQGHCGSCWAFSATGSLEGQHFRKTGKLMMLSEQNLVDCSRRWGNNGCMGGVMNFAFNYIKDNEGINTAPAYPYEAVEKVCRFVRSDIGAEDWGFVDIPQRNEEQLKVAVAVIGPISIAIDASRESFQFYSTGVYNEPHCSSEDLDHGVLVVGYGNWDGEDYWLVKNSWGESWGQSGYMKMARNRGNQCGVATMPSYPLV